MVPVIQDDDSVSGCLTLVPLKDQYWMVIFLPEVGAGLSTDTPRDRLISLLQQVGVDSSDIEAVKGFDNQKYDPPIFEFHLANISYKKLRSLL